MTESVEAAVARCLARANRKFDGAINDLVPGTIPSPAEQLGAGMRKFADAVEVAVLAVRDVLKGFNRG